jgi:hypothetical protein
MYWGRPVKIDTALYPISTQRNLAVALDDISMPLNPDLYGSLFVQFFYHTCPGASEFAFWQFPTLFVKANPAVNLPHPPAVNLSHPP